MTIDEKLEQERELLNDNYGILFPFIREMSGLSKQYEHAIPFGHLSITEPYYLISISISSYEELISTLDKLTKDYEERS